MFTMSAGEKSKLDNHMGKGITNCENRKSQNKTESKKDSDAGLFVL